MGYKIRQTKTVRISFADVPQLRQAECGVTMARLALEEFAPHGTESAERFALLSLAEQNVARARTIRSEAGARFAALAALECSRLAVENLPWLGQVGTPIQA